MKLAFVYDAVYPWISGGVEKRIYELSMRLARKYEVHIFGIKWWKNKKSLKKDNIYLHGVCKPVKLYTDSGRRSIREAIYFAWKLIFSLLKMKIDIIDCQEFPYFPCFSAKLHTYFRHSNFIITWHEFWDDYWYEYLGKIGFFGKIIEKYAIKLAEKNVVVSHETKRALEKFGANDIVLIPNGIDFKKINKIKINDKKYDIIFVGRLIKDKNIDVLIRSISILKNEIPDIKCCILGDGPEKIKLIKLTSNLGLSKNIRFFRPSANHDRVISLLKSSKIFVTPSTREGFGISTLEANACGLPVVTVRHEKNAIKEIIFDGKNGFLCSLSEKDLANKIIMALAKYKKLKNICINFAKKYDWDNIVKQYEILIKTFS